MLLKKPPLFFFFNDTATTEIYTLSLHDALPISYPNLDVTPYTKLLDAMAREVRDRLGRKASSEEIVKALNRYLFIEQGFVGNTHQYYDVDNSYLNKVLERKTGIPISLSMGYLFVGKRLE